MSDQTKAIKDEWWGFCLEHGLVVIDRTIATNRPGKGGKLIFLRCKDWTRYEEDRKRWDPPYYYSSVVQERHRQFLDVAGRIAPATRKVRKKNRASICWYCNQSVDNSIDLECPACG